MDKETGPRGCREIASGVYCLEVGKGIMRSNVYLVRSGPSWVLIDAASANCSQLIKNAAESLFGGNTRPISILLTHNHSDHAGSVLELVHLWGCPAYVHPDELPYSTMTDLSTVEKYANPLDRGVILPLLRLMPRRKVESMLLKSSLKGVLQGFDPDATIPGLPDWKCIPTSGHTPGHVAFFRASDRVLITGDAIVTTQLNSAWAMLLWSLRINRQRVSGPPWYSTWSKQAAKESVVRLAGIQPLVLASGHGMPMSGDRVERQLSVLANRFAGRATATT